MIVALGSGARRRQQQWLDAVTMRADAAGIEALQRLRDALTRADAAENVDEVLLVLAPNAIERYGFDGQRLQRVSIEGIGRLIAETFEHRPVVLLHHRRQLQEIANHDDLDAAERPLVAAHLAQARIDSVDHVGPHHGNLVDDEPVHAPIERSELAAPGEVLRVENGVLQMKERMNGLGAGVERRNPGRRHGYLQLAAGSALHVLDKPRLAGAGAAGDEES